eukprot:1315253-Alexandrium_andersonii.AAC.1
MCAASSRPAFAISTTARAGASVLSAGPPGTAPGYAVRGASVFVISALPGATSSTAAGSPRSTCPADIPLESWSPRRRGPPSGLAPAAARAAAPARGAGARHLAGLRAPR